MKQQVDIDKIYVVNLKDKMHRWKHFERLGDITERVEAVDSRTDWFIHEDYGLSLTPYEKANDHYFTQSKGAVGCYLSHYKIWSDIIEKQIQWTLILEDDAEINSVRDYISNDLKVEIEPGVDVVQLNDRTQHSDLVDHFNGTTAYLINLRGAKILRAATHDFSYFTETPDCVVQWRVDTLNLHGCPELLRSGERSTDAWMTSDSIRLAVDKFIGYNGHVCIPEDRRLKLAFDPKIIIHESQIVSDVTDPGDVYYWDMDCSQLAELEQRYDFKWWERNIKGLELRKHFKERIQDDSIVLICVLRDERLLLPHFIDHYKKLNVTHFIFVDNGSEDGSEDYLVTRDDINCQVYYTTNSYAENEYGLTWVNDILNTQCRNKWCVVVDVDELLMPRDDNCLQDVKRAMTDQNKNVLPTCLVDFYPKTTDQKDYTAGDDFLTHSDHYDRFTEVDISIRRGEAGEVIVKGGMRHRIFGENRQPVCLTKKSFFKYDFYKTHNLSVGMHWILPVDFNHMSGRAWSEYPKWNEMNEHIKIYSDMCAVAHFKFIKPNIYDYFKRRVDRNQDWDNSDEYKNYIKLRTSNLVSDRHSVQYSTVEDIYENLITHLIIE